MPTPSISLKRHATRCALLDTSSSLAKESQRPDFLNTGRLKN
jgi:hypothetical protein